METPLQSILETLAGMVKPGVTTMELENAAVGLLNLHGVKPAFLGYTPKNAPGPYPNVLCVSINNEVIHGIPSDRKIEWGDVVKLDLGLITSDGQYDDGALTVGVNASSTARRLIKVTREAMEAGLAQVKVGKTTHDVANAISAVAKREGFAVVKGYGGHGIGTELHMEPHIPNEPEGEPVAFVAGQRVCIEPMLTSTVGDVVVDPGNKWTVKLPRGGYAAHFEKSIEVR